MIVPEDPEFRIKDIESRFKTYSKAILVKEWLLLFWVKEFKKLYLSMSTITITPTEEQEKIVTAFLNALDISFEKNEVEENSEYVLAGIARGRQDAMAGRVFSFEEFETRFKNAK